MDPMGYTVAFSSNITSFSGEKRGAGLVIECREASFKPQINQSVKQGHPEHI
jgi:hypothetical protein